jgi:hypothetical protein
MAGRPYPYLRLSITGTLDGTNQTWGCDISWSGVALALPSIDQPTMDTLVAQAGVRVAAWGAASAMQSVLGSTDHLTAARLYRYAASNPVAVAGAVETMAIVGASGASMPPQIALVHSLRTLTPGRTGRGRFYVPFRANGPRPSSALVAALATQAATMINGITDDWSTTLTEAMTPVVGMTGAAVVKIEVDDVPDTQRRRRDKITAVNTGSAVISPD